MAVMFVVGAMNLAWMGLFTLVVLGEKIAPANWQLDRILGAILVGSALWWVAGAWITG
jgi:predicted metal-binding membrane protein